MSEKEYIERGSIYRRVKTHTNPYGKPTLDYESGVKVLDMIKQEPAADVVEVRHGRWILNEAWDVRTVDLLICSHCGTSFRYDVAIDYPYCPICITRMDGERKEQT